MLHFYFNLIVNSFFSVGILNPTLFWYSTLIFYNLCYIKTESFIKVILKHICKSLLLFIV
ncbi:hypothetical protein Avbf_07431 [Armadillidium vulgare]|nr:hypothetical protein Avbf_07431 [Armadillidium vulgare]